MSITNIVNKISNTLESTRLPALVLPPLLLKCTSLTRPGLSAYKIATEVIQNNEKLGIPTGPNPDGSENLINAFTYNIIKTFVNALKNDAAISVATPLGSLLIQATGGNAGGPVTCVGTNLSDSISMGIIQ
jgi:hypothetical protein